MIRECGLMRLIKNRLISLMLVILDRLPLEMKMITPMILALGLNHKVEKVPIVVVAVVTAESLSDGIP